MYVKALQLLTASNKTVACDNNKTSFDVPFDECEAQFSLRYIFAVVSLVGRPPASLTDIKTNATQMLSHISRGRVPRWLGNRAGQHVAATYTHRLDLWQQPLLLFLGNQLIDS